MDLHEVLAESLFADELHNLVWRLDKPQADPPPLNVRPVGWMVSERGIESLL